MPIAGQTAYNTFIQPVIDRYGYVQNGVPTGGGFIGYGSQFDQNDFFRNAGQLGYNLTLGSNVAPRAPRRLPALRGRRGPDPQLERLGRASPCPAAARASRARRSSTRRASSSRATGAAAPIHSEYQSQNFELNDTIKWRNWTFNLGVLASNDTLYGQGLREDAVDPLRLRARPRATSTRCTRSPFGKMIQPRLGATWAYNGKDTVYASYATYNPAASSLPRAASWDRNLVGDLHRRLLRRERRALRHRPGRLLLRQAVRRGPDPRTIDEFLIGTARQFSPSWSARLYGRYREGSHFWEDTNNNARVAFNPPAGIPRELYIPDLTGAAGPDRQRLHLRHRRARRRVHEVLRGHGRVRVARRQDLRARLVHLEPLLRQLRPGQLDRPQQRHQHLHRLVEHRRRRRPPALGHQGRRPARRPPAPAEAVRLSLSWPGTRPSAPSSSPSRASRGRRWSFEPYRALTTSTSDTNRYAEPAGSRRIGLALAARPQLHAELPAAAAASNLQLVGRPLQRLRQADRLQHPAARRTTRPSARPRIFFDPRRIQLAARFMFYELEPARAVAEPFVSGRRNSRSLAISGRVVASARCRARVDPRGPVGLLQQHADLRALEERHRVARDATAARDRARRAPPGSAARPGRARPARGRARTPRPAPRAPARTPRARRRLLRAIASCPRRTSSAAVGGRRPTPAAAARSPRPTAPAAPAPRERLERRQPIGRLRDHLLEQRHGARPLRPARVVQREVGAHVAASSGAIAARPLERRLAPARRGRAPSARSPAAARRRGCPDPRRRIRREQRDDRRVLLAHEEARRLLEQVEAARHVRGPRRVLAHDRRRARADVAEARQLPARLLVERLPSPAAASSDGTGYSRSASRTAARQVGARREVARLAPDRRRRRRSRPCPRGSPSAGPRPPSPAAASRTTRNGFIASPRTTSARPARAGCRRIRRPAQSRIVWKTRRVLTGASTTPGATPGPDDAPAARASSTGRAGCRAAPRRGRRAPRRDRPRPRWRRGPAACCSNGCDQAPELLVHRRDLAEVRPRREAAAERLGRRVRRVRVEVVHPQEQRLRRSRRGQVARARRSVVSRADRSARPVRQRVVVDVEAAREPEAARQHEGRDERGRAVARAAAAAPRATGVLGGERRARSRARRGRPDRAPSSSRRATAASPARSRTPGGSAGPAAPAR